MRHMHVRFSELPIRSRGLLLISVIWFLIGLGVQAAPATPVDSAFHFWLPEALHTAIWWAASFGALGAALDKQDGRRDWLALAACTIPPMLRLTSYLWSWIMYLWPGGPPGYAKGWLSAAIYGCLVGLVWLVASIPDVQDEPRE